MHVHTYTHTHTHTHTYIYIYIYIYFPGGSVVKNLLANAGDLGPIPGLGKSAGEGNVNLFQYSCLGDPMDRGAWWAIDYGVAKTLLIN